MKAREKSGKDGFSFFSQFKSDSPCIFIQRPIGPDGCSQINVTISDLRLNRTGQNFWLKNHSRYLWVIRYDEFELDRDKAEKTCGDWAWTHRPPSSKVTKIPIGHKTKFSEFSHPDHPQIITQFRNPKITAQLIIRAFVKILSQIC